MKYRLKDKELQRKLDDISGGDFSKALSSDRLESVCSPLDPLIEWRVCFGAHPDFLANRFSAAFTDDEIESVPEYNPNAWNEYPDVTPPEGVMMRVEARTLDDYGERWIVKFYGAIYVNGAWRSSVEIKYPETLQIFRFRPWEG